MTERKHTRRRYLKLTGAVAAVGLAGCTSSSDSNEGPETDDTATADNHSHDHSSGPNGTESASQDPATQNGTAENGTDATTEGTADGEKLTPHDHGSVHMHGFLTFEVNGERVDYDETRFYEKVTGNENFHFHDRENENLTHVHAKDVTVHYALNSLPGIIVGDRSSIKLDGTTYTSSDAGTSIDVTVNNEQVDLKTYVLGERDHIEVLITTSGSNGTQTNTTSSNETAYQ